MENPADPHPAFVSVTKTTEELMIVIREYSAIASYYY